MILWERFDENEWFTIVMLVLSYAAVWLLPKRVPTSWIILAFVWAIASASVFDFTIGGGLLDFYKINDTNQYELMDAFTYIMFAPFGYFFIYGYELLRITRKTMLFYIAGWAVVGMLFQWVAEMFGMTHYQHGYRLWYNLVAFLTTQTITGLFYAYMRERAPGKLPSPPQDAGAGPDRPSSSAISRRARAKKAPV